MWFFHQSCYLILICQWNTERELSSWSPSLLSSSLAGWRSDGGGGVDEEDGGAAAAAGGGGVHSGGDGHSLWEGEEREHTYRYKHGSSSSCQCSRWHFCLLTSSSCLLCVCAAVVRGAPPELLLHLVEEPEFRYEDFAPRGEQAPPTMRAQVHWMFFGV